MSQNSYLRQFSAQVSKIVFLADLTVLRLIITDEQKCRKTHISTRFLRVSKNRVLNCFDCFTAYYNCMSKNVTKLISPRVQCTSIKNRVPSRFGCFTAYYYCLSKNITKLISPRLLGTKYHKSCS